MFLNNEEVIKLLPHRDPFLFIDTVESVKHPAKELDPKVLIDIKDIAGAEVVAYYRTKADHPIFKGHFPGNPILPGVVQVEMMAQATSFMVFLSYDNPLKLKMDVALLSINEAKFRKPIYPEMDLKIITRVLKMRGTMVTSECKLYHNDQLMSEATVLASLKMQ